MSAIVTLKKRLKKINNFINDENNLIVKYLNNQITAIVKYLNNEIIVGVKHFVKK